MLFFLSLFFFLVLFLLFPLFFAELMFAALVKLQLTPSAALTLLLCMFVGGLFDIPIKTFVREREVVAHPLAVYGLGEFWPRLRRVQRKSIIAVNVGGCLIPAGLAIYEFAHIALAGASVLFATIFGVIVNVLACYLQARPVAGVGITLPAFVSPMLAAALALLLAPDMAAPAAFVIGVLGPLVGADLMHLRDVEASEIAVLSIGGAGTFDGIVLSGILAAYLA